MEDLDERDLWMGEGERVLGPDTFFIIWFFKNNGPEGRSSSERQTYKIPMRGLKVTGEWLWARSRDTKKRLDYTVTGLWFSEHDNDMEIALHIAVPNVIEEDWFLQNLARYKKDIKRPFNKSDFI